MPSLTMSSVALPSMRFPSNRTVPDVLTIPHTARSVVVLPAPLAPRIVVMPPDSTANDRPWSTLVHPYWARRSSAWRSAGMPSVAPEVRLDHVGVFLDLRRRPLGDLAAEVEHDDPVRDLHHQAHVVLDEENA